MTSAQLSAGTSSALVSPSLSSMSAGMSSPGPIHIGHLIKVELTPETYMFWRAQNVSLLHSNLLFGYVDGTLKCPSPTLSHLPKDAKSEDQPTVVPNPAYVVWKQQDPAILSAILSSMAIEVSGMVMFAGTSHEAWSTLEGSFASQSSTRAGQIRTQMSKTRKLDSSAQVFFNKLKSLSNTLTSIGRPLRPEEFQDYVLDGLDEEYDGLVEAVRGHNPPMPMHDLYARVLHTEHRMANRRSDLGDSIHSAHATKMGRGSRPGGSAPYQPPSGPPSFTSPSAPRPNYSPSPTGGSGGGRPGGNRPVCQLCGEVGHVASTCFKRFQKGFLGIGNDGRFTSRQLSMANHVTGGRTQQTRVVDPAWYLDTGAMDHFANELNKLHVKEPYHGKEKVHTTDGSGSGYPGGTS